tara:strand:- start:9976 stop:10377 length:402 start_codon:yes stop_codon:yes gene_type:complete
LRYIKLAISNRYKSWIRRKDRIRKKVFGKIERPRLTVFRSSKHIYCQLIDDEEKKTILSASSTENIFTEKSEEIKDSKVKPSNIKGAELVGEILGSRAKEKGIESIVYDRNGYNYHGRVRALADGIRKMGVKF